ncbi:MULTISPECIES: GntR family transcriptional regulator [unclassified Clostridium]|uniref:GntR family transcriptional regulator n=1 Tax=unclassified Clostridium TaxID=2614128 RepID=UPI0002977682|nr:MULTISPECIES: GntR family transcriptional regulator [unclassified Clostridium]EKQ56522.1 MAG: transcriptional regulator [Clostridium sp. Maddingley MBC34-26]
MKSDYIINDLIEKITSGEFEISSRIPSDAQLAIKYQCNRHTIRKAIAHLIERSYLIKSLDGSTYVNDINHYNNSILFVSSLSDYYNSENIKSDVNEFKLINASEKLCKLLKIEIHSQVWLIKRVRYIDSRPNHTEEIYMPHSLFPNLTMRDCKSSLLSYIESQYDYKISHGIRTVSPIKLNEYEINLLNLPNESVVMQIENIGYLTNGRIYEYSISKSRGSKFQYYCRR